jgi:hypothetical protein
MTKMCWRLHSITVAGSSSNARVTRRWQATFASRPHTDDTADVRYHLEVVDRVPESPAGEPRYRQGDLLAYFVRGDRVIAHLPRYGQLRIGLADGTTEARIVIDAIESYGVLEDLVAVGLSPHLRRRGMFLLHAFAAARAGRTVLLVGDVGAGKTTTGMALLDAGWRLLSNDSPIISTSAEVLSYPGLLAAYPDTFARLKATRHLADNVPPGGGKITVRAETLWPDVWLDRAVPGAVVFPQIESRSDHSLEPLAPPDALRGLLPHAVEQWDRPMIGEHLRVMRLLVERAPAFRLRLGPDVASIPGLLGEVLG